MLQTIIILILLGIVVYLVFDKKGLKSDDIKLFFKNIGIKAKEKFLTFLDKAKDFFNSVKRKTSENPENLPSVIETSNNENESANDFGEIKEETIARSNQKSNKKGLIITMVITGLLLLVYYLFNYFEYDPCYDLAYAIDSVILNPFVIALAALALFIFLMVEFPWFRHLMLVLLSILGRLYLVVLILGICITPFVYKKTILDYDGKYATDRLVYTEEYGFCMLITYYPDYHSGDAKGFAVTNIPFEALFSEEIQADRNGNDTADSKEMLDSYQMLATLGDNALVDSLAKFFFDSKISTRSIQIGKYGNYFAINAKNIGYGNSKDNLDNRGSYSYFNENILNNEKIEEEYSPESDYSPILIRP